ncbi:MAG: hypothetical protein AAGB93_07490 [Planctomycetota bacterium]
MLHFAPAKAKPMHFVLGATLLAAPTVAAPQDGSSNCPVDMVIVMDTSGSMSDEISALCTDLANIVATLQAQNIDVVPDFLGITSTRDCLTTDVLTLLGPTIPDAPLCCTMLNHPESWAAGAAIVAERYQWRPNTVRLVIPISDEAAWRGGNSCNADDQASVDALIVTALANGAVIAPIAGTGSSQCVIDAGAQIALATGGENFVTTDPSFDLGAFIINLAGNTCAGTGTIDIACPGVSCPCGNDSSAPDEGCLNSTGVGGKLSWTGGTSVAADDLSLELSNLPTNEFSMVVAGNLADNCSPLGDGLNGLLPSYPMFMHFPVQNTGASGSYSTGAGVPQRLAALTNQMSLDLIGTTWRFQGVYRDQDLNNSPCTTGFNLTNVVEVQFSN